MSKPVIRAHHLLDFLAMLESCESQEPAQRAYREMRVYVESLRDDATYQRYAVMDEGPTFAQIQRGAVS